MSRSLYRWSRFLVCSGCGKESDDSSAASAQPSITARSAVLIDADSGTVLFENNADEKTSPASVTKVMTMLLIMEAVDSGKISLDDKVTISERSASMAAASCIWNQAKLIR